MLLSQFSSTKISFSHAMYDGCATTRSAITNIKYCSYNCRKVINVGNGSRIRIRCQNSEFRRPKGYSSTELLQLPSTSSTVSNTIISDRNNVSVIPPNFTNENSLSDTSATTTLISPPFSPAGDNEIGIVNFLRGKNYFITGATGFLAKVFIEKMLRTVPDVGKIYLLIKAKDNEAATDRLKIEIIESELFKCLQQKHGKSYKEFMTKKLIPVAGDVGKSNLGMDAVSAAHIAKDIDVIVNAAANTAFHERFDVALNINTRGPARLMSFAKECKKLCLFLHISTAYVNGEREGVVAEKPFFMGQSVAGERAISDPEGALLPILDLEAEMKLASDLLKSVNEKEATQRMKDLGLERARIYGWQNTYVFTKAMGEMVINNMRREIPVVIVRPSIIESTYGEPFPGWIQGNRMLDPVILSYGKGQLPGFIADPKTLIDVVPADMVVNATIAAMAKHGIAAKPELNVYHVASSVVNPVNFHDIFKFSCNHFTSSPLNDSKGNKIPVSEIEFLSSMDKFSSYISNVIARQSGLEEGTNSDPNVQRMVQKKCKKKAERVVHMAKVYEPYTFFKGWFDNRNTQKLIQEMSIEEKWNFGFGVETVEWKHYFMNIHIPGLKKHVMMMKEKTV